MKINLTFIALCFFYLSQISAQSNCGNPYQVTICPNVYLTGQTNAGMGDDAPAACNIAGEDIVYRVNVPGGATRLHVMVNSNGPLKLMVQSDTCGSNSCSSFVLGTGTNNRTFIITAANYYTVCVDAAATITFNISFGAATSSVYTTIPDTQGNLNLDSSVCNVPIFSPAKPFFQVAYNSIYKTHPMTLSPLMVSGVLKVVVYFKNTTGIEGIKRFTFQFNPYGGPGFTSISPAPASNPGFYRPGNWLATGSGNSWMFDFSDLVTPGKGDFNFTPNTCLRYEFNFNVTPVSNNISYTTVNVTALSDGFGVGWAGWVYSGCCPLNYSTCHGASSGNTNSAANSFGFGFADPGGPLPITLLAFSAEQENDHILLQWSTATEVNNDFFTVEKSQDGISWTVSDIVTGAGNSASTKHYKSIDPYPLAGLSYYRLKQTDYDGVSEYFSPVDVFYFLKKEIEIFPNPARDKIEISNLESENSIVNIYNGVGKLVFGQEMSTNNQKHVIDVSKLASGLYLFVIETTNGDILKQEKMVLAE